MAESRSHKRGKGNAARQEVPISGGRRLDAIRGKAAIEVERGGTPGKIDQALSRLRTDAGGQAEGVACSATRHGSCPRPRPPEEDDRCGDEPGEDHTQEVVAVRLFALTV